MKPCVDCAVLGLDLSKSSTGFSIFLVNYDESELVGRIVGSWSGVIKQPTHSNYLSKHSFLAVWGIWDEIDYILDSLRMKYEIGSFSVAIEHSIFAAQASPLQYYLQARVLEFFRSQNLDVVLYSPAMVKKMMASLSGGKSSVKNNKKEVLRQYGIFYDKLLGDINFYFPKIDDVFASDEVDAISLGLLAIFFQALQLSVGHRNFGKIETVDELLGVREVFRKTFLDLGCLRIIGIESNVKDAFKTLVKNGHLLISGSKMFFPFYFESMMREFINKALRECEDRESLVRGMKSNGFIDFGRDALELILSGKDLIWVSAFRTDQFFPLMPYRLKSHIMI